MRPRDGHELLHPEPPGPVVHHLHEPALAQREQLGDDAEELLGDVDRDALHRLVEAPVDRAGHDLRLADRQLEPLAPHHLDEDRELQLAAPWTSQVSGRSVSRTRIETLPTTSWSSRPCSSRAVTLSPSWPASGDGVDPDRHRERRLVDPGDRERPRIVGVGEGLADRDLGDPGDRADLAGAGLLGFHAVERLGDVQLTDLRLLDRPVGAAPRHRLAAADRPLAHAAEREPADVRRRVEVRHERLQRVARPRRRARGCARAAW